MMKQSQDLRLPSSFQRLDAAEMEKICGGSKFPIRDIQDFLAKLFRKK